VESISTHSTSASLCLCASKTCSYTRVVIFLFLLLVNGNYSVFDPIGTPKYIAYAIYVYYEINLSVKLVAQLLFFLCGLNYHIVYTVTRINFDIINYLRKMLVITKTKVRINYGYRISILHIN
jgi:hypothetical protein